MKNKIISFTLIFIGLLSLCLSLSTCSVVGFKKAPEYNGVDPRVLDLLNEYKALAKIQGINFKNQVTVGFKTIKDGNAVGLTTYGHGWREIDLDDIYWHHSDSITHLALFFHELTHAYCGREHDYGDGILYPDPQEIEKTLKEGKTDLSKGYYKDFCPKSLMFPIVMPTDCMLLHYQDYVVEMFQRCEVY